MRYAIPLLLATCVAASAQSALTAAQVQASLQASITAADAVPATAKLIAQRTALESQPGALNEQILAAEGPDVQKARQLLVQMKRLVRPGRPVPVTPAK